MTSEPSSPPNNYSGGMAEARGGLRFMSALEKSVLHTCSPAVRLLAVGLFISSTSTQSQYAQAQTTTAILPSSAYRVGAGGAEFHTDVRVMNPGTSEIKLFLTFYDQSSSEKFASPPVSIPPRSQTAFDNIHASVFGRSLAQGAYGPIRFEATGPLIVSASVNNVNACMTGATSGQWLPGIDALAAVKSGVVPHLAVSATLSSGYRTNLVFANPGGEAAFVTIKVRSGTGQELATGSIGPLATNGFQQVALDNPSTFPGMSGRTDTNLWVEFSATSPILAFASIINNASGDPFAVLATKDSSSP